VWLGCLKKLAESAGGNVLAAHKMLCWFFLVGWAIYPLGYMAGTDGWYSGFEDIFLKWMLFTMLVMQSTKSDLVLLYIA